MKEYPAKFKLTPVDGKTVFRRENLACPDCGYSLRGLPGDLVRCPECGRQCDLAAMIRNAWTLPWYRVPGFDMVASPAAWPVVGGILTMFMVWLLRGVFDAPTHPATITFAAVISIGWLWAMSRVWRKWPGPVGVRLSILAHFVIAGLILLFAGMGVCLVFFVFGLTNGRPGIVILSVLATAILPGGITLCHRGQRVIAEQCIRRYLNQTPADPSKLELPPPT